MQKKTCKPIMLSRMWLATRRSLSLQHWPPQEFASCQWQSKLKPTTSYLIYRWILFLLVVSIGTASFACQSMPKNYKGPVKEINLFKWFIYFTNWGYIFIIMQSGLSLLVCHRYRTERNQHIVNEDSSPRCPRTPLLCRVYWVAHTIATDLAFVITLVYWTLVYNPELHEINALNVLVHGGNSIIMFSELIITNHPVRFAHAVYSACLGMAYGVFSAIYWALGGTDRFELPAIYPHLNWNEPGKALGFVALCAFIMMVAHALATSVVATRVRLAARILPAHVKGERLTLPTY